MLAPELLVQTTSATCLNCGAPLGGPYCSACGQRDAPPQPTLGEMVLEARHELTIFDARLLRTTAMLLARPGSLTLEFLAGRRGRYIKPLRLYLITSFLYFLAATFIPAPRVQSATVPGREGITIDLSGATEVSEEQRAQALKALDRAPRIVQPIIRRAALDPAGLQRNVMDALPKVLFGLVPVFAAIVGIFFSRPFSHHLVFSLHLHAAVFLLYAVRKLAQIGGNIGVMQAVQGITLLFLLVYALRAFRRVYAERWLLVLSKCAGIVVLYLIVGVAGLFLAIAWAARGG